MKLKFTKPKTKTEWNLFITGEETIFNPIKKQLADDPSISFVGFKKNHPQLEGITFIIKGKNVETSFKKAIKELTAELKELNTLF